MLKIQHLLIHFLVEFLLSKLQCWCFFNIYTDDFYNFCIKIIFIVIVFAASGLQLFIAKDGTAALGNHEVKSQMSTGVQVFKQVVMDDNR